MLRITFKWSLVSPFLNCVSGIMTLEDIDISAPYSKAKKKVLSCQVFSDNNTLAFGSFPEETGIPTQIFEKIKPIIIPMIESYRRGVALKKEDYLWVEKGVDLEEIQQSISELDPL